MDEKNKSNMIKYKDPKDVAIGISFLVGGLFFFVIMTFWLIISKIMYVDEKTIQNMPYIIQFIIHDKHYSIVILIFLPILIIIFYFRLMAYNYFRHSF